MKYTPKSWDAVQHEKTGKFGYREYYVEADGGKLVAEGICNPEDAAIIAVAPEGYELAQLVTRLAKEEVSCEDLSYKYTEFSEHDAALIMNAAEEILVKVERNETNE